MKLSELAGRLRGRYQRTAARMCFRDPSAIHSTVPLVSFTFDDFPRSALLIGGAILKQFGGTGTYYASLGLIGQDSPSGPVFQPDDLRSLLGEGHELGCHTFGHCDSWETPASAFERSIAENTAALRKLIPAGRFRTFSYPMSPPRPTTKRRTMKHFECCRGGGQTSNAGVADRGYLAAYFLEQARNDIQPVKQLIDENVQAQGWLIFATHDISRSPSPYGCTPEFFEESVHYAAASGARILPVVQAWTALRAAVRSESA